MSNSFSQGGLATPADVAAALVAINLDHLVAVADAGLTQVTVDSIMGQLFAMDGDPSAFDDNTQSMQAIGARAHALRFLIEGADPTLASITDNSIVAQILAIGGDVSDFNNNNMSMEAIRALLGVVDGKSDAIGVIATDIHDTDLPAVITAIAEKSIRGEFTHFAYNGAPGDTVYHDMVNVTGSGEVVCIMAGAATTTGMIRITIDGEVSDATTIAADTNMFVQINASTAVAPLKLEFIQLFGGFPVEFKTDFRVEQKQSNGANNSRSHVVYNLD